MYVSLIMAGLGVPDSMLGLTRSHIPRLICLCGCGVLIFFDFIQICLISVQA